MFEKYSNADCLLYDNEDCTTDDIPEPLAVSSGAMVAIHPKHEFANEIESVSIKQGCGLSVWTGNYLNNSYWYIITV